MTMHFNSTKQMMAHMRSLYTDRIPRDINKEFSPVALGIFANNCEVYTKETKRSWSKVFVKNAGGFFTIEFGNSAPQALYSEYGTIRKFSHNKVRVGAKVFTSKTSKSKDRRRSNGKSAWQNISEWATYQGITDRSVIFMIYREIMKNGRQKSPRGMYTAIPSVSRVFKRILQKKRV